MSLCEQDEAQADSDEGETADDESRIEPDVEAVSVKPDRRRPLRHQSAGPAQRDAKSGRAGTVPGRSGRYRQWRSAGTGVLRPRYL